MSDAKPKHLGAGLAKGFGTAVTGIAAGVGLAVAAPVAGAALGAKKAGVAGGIAGGVGGLLAGVAGLVVAPVYGVFRGTYVAAQGLVETPGYLKAVVQDDDLHGKETIDLPTVEAATKAEDELYESSRRSVEEEAEFTPTATPKETQLYEALAVQPDSSAGQIKKAYYKLAMTHHPDKGGDTEKFQQIGDAYQVLSDKGSRKKYDAEGVAGLEKKSMVDPGVVFMMMFGDSQFEHLVGDLAIVQQQRLADKGLEPAALAAKLKELHAPRADMAPTVPPWMGRQGCGLGCSGKERPSRSGSCTLSGGRCLPPPALCHRHRHATPPSRVLAP